MHADRPLFASTVGGFPRNGPHRELERAITAHRADPDDPGAAAALADVAGRLNASPIARATAAGLESVPVGTFSFGDRMLDAAVLCGALGPGPGAEAPRPAGLPAWLGDYLDARERRPLRRWFGTPLEYAVPALAPGRPLAADPGFLLDQVRAARRLHAPARAVLMGPATFLALAEDAPLHRLAELVGVHRRLLDALAGTGVRWVQYDEPILAAAGAPAAAPGALRRLVEHAHGRGLRVLVNTFRGDAARAVAALAGVGADAVGLDLVTSGVPELRPLPERTLVAAGVIDALSPWRTDLDAALELLAPIAATRPVAASTSAPLVHLPWSVAAEEPSARLRPRLAYAAEKVAEAVDLGRALHYPGAKRRPEFLRSRRARA